jgi:hypothetical protein
MGISVGAGAQAERRTAMTIRAGNLLVRNIIAFGRVQYKTGFGLFNPNPIAVLLFPQAGLKILLPSMPNVSGDSNDAEEQTGKRSTVRKEVQKKG